MKMVFLPEPSALALEDFIKLVIKILMSAAPFLLGSY